MIRNGYTIESGANLEGAKLRHAYLTGANLYGANLRRANLEGANLYGADLEGADLYCANLFNAYLRRADLTGADLRGAKLEGANLEDAKLARATMPDGRKWEDYRLDHLAGICDQPEVRARAIAAWGGHSWSNCPMHAAHGVDSSIGLAMSAWVALYDAHLLEKPE